MNTPRTMGEIMNIGSSDEHTVLEFAEKVKSLVGSSSTIQRSESLPENDPRKRRADITKAKKMLDWEPTVTLSDGLMRTIEWVRSDVV